MTNPLKTIMGSLNWDDFENNLSKFGRKQKGDCFEELTRFFLKTNPTYISKIKNIWNINEEEVPRDIQKKLNLPGRDEGIDLLAQLYNGKYWTIQCKYKSNSKVSLNREDVSTFLELSFTICNQDLIEMALICTPAEKYSHKFDKFYNTNSEEIKFNKIYNRKKRFISFIYGQSWKNLQKDEFSKIKKFILSKKIEFKSIKKAQHQIEALNKISKHFNIAKKSKGKLILPCGTGKSLIGYWATQKLNSNKIIVLIPSLALVKQTFQNWAKENLARKIKFDWIVVCSDKTTIKSKRDDVSIQLSDFGVKVVSDDKELMKWMNDKSFKNKTVFSTYDSSHIVQAALKKSKFNFDLGIYDEAHKTAGSSGSKFSKLLTSKKINRKIFMTATERFYEGRKKNFFSMDDEKIYGEMIYKLTFSQALKKKRPDGSPIITDYKIVNIEVYDTELLSLLRENRYLSPTNETDWEKDPSSHSLASAIALKKAFQDYKIDKIISFHSNTDRAKDFQYYLTKLNKFFETKNFFINGVFATFKRQNIIDDFVNSDKSVISNARCLTEGVDIPVCNGIIFVDPKQSRTDIVQAVGRALRPYKNKKFGYIIIPILIKSSDTQKDKIKKRFETIISTVDAIGSLDENLIDFFIGKSSGETSSLRNPIENVETISYGVDFEKIYNEVNLKISARLQGLTKIPLNEKTILEWIDKFYAKHNKWPTQNSGKIDDVENETWMGVSQSLLNGYRGIKNKISFANFLKKHRGVKNLANLDDISIENIVFWAKDHYSKTGKYPRNNSGVILINTNESWAGIDDALREGRRGLPKTSLVKLLEQEGLDFAKSKIGRKDLSDEIVKRYISDYFNKNSKYPLATSNEIIPNSNNTKWSDIAQALSKGLRGLKPGRTFAIFLKDNFGYINPDDNYNREIITEDMILSKADEYFEQKGKWPKTDSGNIAGFDITWRTINERLKSGNLGLRASGGLASLLFEKRSVNFAGKHKSKKNFTDEYVLQLCDAFYEKNNRYPNSKDRDKLVDGEKFNWRVIVSAYSKGRRGLKKGMSIAKLLKKNRNVINKYSNQKPKLSIKEIKFWIKEYIKDNDKPPVASEKKNVKGQIDENWHNLDNALRIGLRGLPRGNSLAKLVKKI